MELLIPVGVILLTGLVGSIIVEIYDYIQMSRWMHQRHMRELKLAMHPEFFSRAHDVSADEIRKALDIYKTSGVTTHLPTGEVDVLGPGKVYFFGGPKVGTVTGVVSKEEMTDEAERLIKEAHNRTVD